MLVLSRKPGESIRVGGGITITVCTIDRGRVAIGIEAPRETGIVRSELLEVEDGEHSPVAGGAGAGSAAGAPDVAGTHGDIPPAER